MPDLTAKKDYERDMLIRFESSIQRALVNCGKRSLPLFLGASEGRGENREGGGRAGS